MSHLRYALKYVTDFRRPSNKRMLEIAKKLRKSQYWKREDIEKDQKLKLRNIVKHSYENVPYYHDVFKSLGLKPDNIQGSADLRKLPLLTKDIIRNTLDELTSSIQYEDSVNMRTGGSTGTPMKFIVNRSMQVHGQAANLRGFEWCGYEFGDKCAYLWGSSFDMSKTKSARGKITNIFHNRLMLNAFDLSDEKMKIYATEIKKFKPKVLRGYASALHTFSNFVQNNNIQGIKPLAIVTTAENLFDFQRRNIEETFNCKIFDAYGSRETSLIAHECEARDGYHISDENSIVEFLDKNNEPVAPGESGRIVITDLHNMVMPWIRYEIGDMGTPTDEKCSCGRTLSMMKSIDGRVHDMFITPDGRRIPGEFFPHLFKDVDGITEYRLTQKSREKIVVEIVKSKKFKDADVQYLLKHMKEYLGEKVEFEFVYLDRIEWPESGKRRFTVSEVVE